MCFNYDFVTHLYLLASYEIVVKCDVTSLDKFPDPRLIYPNTYVYLGTLKFMTLVKFWKLLPGTTSLIVLLFIIRATVPGEPT
jgi:hypothetical protein